MVLFKDNNGSYTSEDLQNLIRAGEVAKYCRDLIIKKIEVGLSIATLYDYSVNLITHHEDVLLAFPPNISVNAIAAHDTAAIKEERIFCKGDVVKIDIGVNVGEMMCDTARTIVVGGQKGDLIEAVEEALQNAIEIIHANMRPEEIGKVIQHTIRQYGLKPIRNLTGHQITKGNLYAGLLIPNIGKRIGKRPLRRLQAGMILAIEPFSTNGKAGYTRRLSRPLIYSAREKPGSKVGLLLYKLYQSSYFSLRDGVRHLKKRGAKPFNLRQTLERDHFFGRAPLMEASGGMVAQAENTVLVTTNGCKVLT
ncbi:MAG: M24 family metallopeptidase [Promethearchaeota archaeon]